MAESTKGYVPVEAPEETAPRSPKGTDKTDRRAPNRDFAGRALGHK
jgi:hypothetical protein